MVNFGPLTAEIGLPVWGTPANFNEFRILTSLLHRRCSLEVNQTLHIFGRLLGWYIIYTFLGAFAFNGILPAAKFCQLQNSLYVQVLCSPILASLLHSTPATGVSQTVTWYKESQRAQPIFGWAAIMLGIVPHLVYYLNEALFKSVWFEADGRQLSTTT